MAAEVLAAWMEISMPNGPTEPETAFRVANGVASLDDFIAAGTAGQVLIELLRQEYGGGDHLRALVADRILNALWLHGSLKAKP